LDWLLQNEAAIEGLLDGVAELAGDITRTLEDLDAEGVQDIRNAVKHFIHGVDSDV
jgi:hypothetical protein